MAKISPVGAALNTASRVSKALPIIKELAPLAGKIRHSYPKGAEFIEDIATRLATEKDPYVTEKQLEFLRGLAERNLGHIPGEARKVVWKK